MAEKKIRDKKREKRVKAPRESEKTEFVFSRSHKEKTQESLEKKSAFMAYANVALWAFIVLAGAITFFFLLQKIKTIIGIIKAFLHIISPIIVGFGLAYVLDPLVMTLEKWYLGMYNKRRDKRIKKDKKVKESGMVPDDANPALVDGRKSARVISIIVTVVIVVLAFALIMMAVIPALIDSVSGLAEKLPDYMVQIEKYIDKFISKHPKIKQKVPDANSIFETFKIYERLEDLLNDFMSKAADWVFLAIKIVYNVFIGLVVAVYLLAGKERFIGQCKKLVFGILKPERAKHLVQNLNGTNHIFKKSIVGKILDSIIIGLICYITMGILGLFGMEAIGDNKVLISIVIGVTNVVPFFGPFFGGIPSALLVFCINPIEGVIMGVLVLVLQQFDGNYLTPMIVGKSVGLSPFYVLVFILIGGGLFGVIGMLLAVPVGAVIYAIVKSEFEEKLAKRHLPIKTNEYAMVPGATIYNRAVAAAEEVEAEKMTAENVEMTEITGEFSDIGEIQIEDEEEEE